MTFSLGWNDALGNGKTLQLYGLKVNQLFAGLKYDTHWMSLEDVTQNYYKKVTVCLLLIVPVTWFHFSSVRVLSLGAMICFSLCCRSSKVNFCNVSKGLSGVELPDWKITEILLVLLKVVWQFSAVLEELTQGTRFCQSSHVILEMNRQPNPLSSSHNP